MESDYILESDYIFSIWRPDEKKPDETRKQAGKYQIKVSKNRHGSSQVAHVSFPGIISAQENVENIPPYIDGGLGRKFY